MVIGLGDREQILIPKVKKASPNNVLVAKIEGLVIGILSLISIIIACCKKGLVSSPSFFINQPVGIWDIKKSSPPGA